MMILAAVDWQPYAIVASLIGTFVTAGFAFLKGRTDAGAAEKAQEALNASKMVETSFASMGVQLTAAQEGQKNCEQRCDQLRDELLDTRQELMDTKAELRDTKAELRITNEQLRTTQTELHQTQEDLAALKEKPT